MIIAAWLAVKAVVIAGVFYLRRRKQLKTSRVRDQP
jgi:hypothetical protein